MKKYLYIILIVLFWTKPISSQNYKEHGATWLAYTGQYKFSPKWGMHLEAQIRMDEIVRLSRQNLFRIGAIYYVNPKLNFAMGYGLINTYNSTYANYFSESRIWEQTTYTIPWREKKNVMTNRLRIEQRFVDHLAKVKNEVKTDVVNYQNRVRLLNRHTFSLVNSEALHGSLYLFVQDEVFVNIGTNNINKSVIDQNRAAIGFGILYGGNTRFELSYMNHFVNPYKSAATMNHTVVFAITHNLNFYQEKN